MGRLYTIVEAAEVLNVPLRDKVTAGAVPHTRLGRHVRFSDAHLAQIVAAGERRAHTVAAHGSPTGRLRRRAAS